MLKEVDILEDFRDITIKNYVERAILVLAGSSTSNVDGNDESVLICQIYFKSSHTAAECWHKYIENYVPQQPRSYNKDRNHKSTYMVCFKPSPGSYYNLYNDSWPITHSGSMPSYSMPHMYCPPGFSYMSDSMGLHGVGTEDVHVGNCKGPSDKDVTLTMGLHII